MANRNSMTPLQTVTTVYRHVVDDVIKNIRAEFQKEDVDEGVLQELRELWEMKLMQTGAIAPPAPPTATANNEGGVGKQVLPGPGSGRAPAEDTGGGGSTARGAGGGGNGRTGAHNLPPAPPPPQQLPSSMPSSMFEPHRSPEFNIATPQDMPFSLNPPMTPVSPVTASGEPVVFQYLPTGLGGAADDQEDVKPNLGRPDRFMPQPTPWLIGRNPPGVDVNVAYDEEQDDLYSEPPRPSSPVTQDFFAAAAERKRKRESPSPPRPRYQYDVNEIPQQDGAPDSPEDMAERLDILGRTGAADQHSSDLRICAPAVAREAQRRAIRDLTADEEARVDADAALLRLAMGECQVSTSGSFKEARPGGVRERCIPQVDGGDGEYEDYDAPDDDYNDQGNGVSDVGMKGPKQERLDEEEEDDEPPLNENDDDEPDDVNDPEEGPTIHNLVLAQFDKVTRSKNKWKCTLKEGVMHLNGRDILFQKANGEFEW